MNNSPPCYALSNLVAQQTTAVVPWEYNPNIPEPAQRTKQTFQSWLSQPGTKHCLYSLVEGQTPGMRVSENNSPHCIHGLVADYDAIVGEELLSRVLSDRPGEFPPNWVHKTYSGGARLIWLFEAPALTGSLDLAAGFLRLAAKHLKANRYLPGFDTESSLRPSSYYEVGSGWRELDTQKVPSTFIWTWLFEAGNILTHFSVEDPIVPVKDLTAELEVKFPGRWPGEFNLGASGPRFWDISADNPRGCVVRRTGMQCFTGPQAFVTWGQIFGASFIEKFKAETLGAVMAGSWYDGKLYWRKSNQGVWYGWSKEDFKLYLKGHHGLSMVKPKGQNLPELERVLDQVHEQKRVIAALPYVHLPDGELLYEGDRLLNTSTLKCLPPAESGSVSDWGDKFPWLAEFFDVFFVAKPQKDYFLAWLRYFYVNALAFQPRLGQALIIAGPVNRGKTLLSTVIVSRVVGGHADASDYFLGEEKFTSHIISKPLMCIDDTVPASSYLRHARYSATLKKVTASQSHTYEKKFQSAGKIPWTGRVIITCNTDPESIRLLPSLDISNAEKISLLRCSQVGQKAMNFPDSGELSKLIDRELPFFCRWLIDWKGYQKFKGTSRMGVIHFHDADLYETAIQAGGASTFLELLHIFLKDYQNATQAVSWSGSSSLLLSQMLLNEALRPLASKLTPNTVACRLGQLKSRGFSITLRRTHAERTWDIPVNIMETNHELIPDKND